MALNIHSIQHHCSILHIIRMMSPDDNLLQTKTWRSLLVLFELRTNNSQPLNCDSRTYTYIIRVHFLYAPPNTNADKHFVFHISKRLYYINITIQMWCVYWMIEHCRNGLAARGGLTGFSILCPCQLVGYVMDHTFSSFFFLSFILHV